MPLTPTQKKKFRAAIADFCLIAESARLRWHYTQARPYTGLGIAPGEYHAADCSSYCALAFNYAQKMTGAHVSDPLNEGYSGWGYTGTQYAFLKATPAPAGRYLVGDMALWSWRSGGPIVHTSICRIPGAEKAIFSSNGHESQAFTRDAPEPLTIRQGKALQFLVGVYRHPELT